MNDLVFAPASKAQEQFLLSNAWLTIYGGAAFAGKSFCTLGSMLPIIGDPGTRACVVRKTTKMLSGGSGLFDAAIHLYSKIDPKMKIKTRDLTLVFSSGAEIQFTYLDKIADRMNVQGKEFSRIAIDEGTQLTMDNSFYLLSRLRSSRVKYPLRATITCNPDPSSYLYSFVEFLLDENKVPEHKEEYPTRYFVRNESGFHFYDTFEEANANHPPSRQYGSPVKTYKFIPGKMSDLPQSVLDDNAGYISTLKQLPITEARRLLNGAWVHEQSSGFFKRDWVTMVDHPNVHATKRVRAWDIASSEPSESNPRVDATAGVLISKDDKRKVYTVEDVVTLRKRIHEVEKLIFETAERDTTSVVIAIPLDPGATAGAYSRDLARRLSERGFTVKLVRPEKGKIQRFLPFASVAEAGFVQIVRGDWNERYIHELETTQFNRKTHDDQADATSDAFYCLNRAFTMPTLLMSSLQSMTQPVTQSNFLNLGSGSNFRIPTYNNIN